MLESVTLPSVGAKEYGCRAPCERHCYPGDQEGPASGEATFCSSSQGWELGGDVLPGDMPRDDLSSLSGHSLPPFSTQDSGSALTR